MTRREFLASAAVASVERPAAKTVVLTLDDAVKSHRTFVAPLLRELGFGATFFVSHRWMDDREHFMSWSDIAELHALGFEIGNHSWTHADFSTPRNAARLEAELELVDYELHGVKVSRPASFAWCGNTFGPEALAVLRRAGYRFARRGKMPETSYGTLEIGPVYDPARHDPLLIPTTGDAYPAWTLDQFIKVVSRAASGRIAVLQFHGVPDIAHPWVHTPPERFREYMGYLKEHDFRVIALRDVERFIDRGNPPADPVAAQRYPPPGNGKLPLPAEMEASRADASYWIANMIGAHRFSVAEAAAVLGWSEARTRGVWERRPALPGSHVLPYPGGRHPRIGFLDGAVSPLRGSKASVFVPWDLASYVVVDLPEAIFCNLGLLFLAHTHIPTLWDKRNVAIGNTDWKRLDGGVLESHWRLPNEVTFGARIEPAESGAAMELWLRNGTAETLRELRTQVCVLLKGAAGFNAQTNENKLFDARTARVRSAHGGASIATEWERCGRTWGNAACPCMHSDPVLPDCPPGETVRVRGRLKFARGQAA